MELSDKFADSMAKNTEACSAVISYLLIYLTCRNISPARI
jgi:hypothetical protein